MAEFYTTCFEAEYSQILDEDDMSKVYAWLQGSLAEDMVAIDHPDTITMACMHGSELVGTAIYAQRHDTVYVWGMYVLPGKLRKGVGSFLIKEVANSVALDKFFEVSVLATSKSAMNFYSKLGFQTCETKISEVFPGIELPIELMRCQTKSIHDLKL